MRVINHFYHGDNDPSDEPTEPTPVESDFHGEAFPAHTVSQEDQPTAEEEMFILLMRPLIPGLFRGPVFALRLHLGNAGNRTGIEAHPLYSLG